MEPQMANCPPPPMCVFNIGILREDSTSVNRWVILLQIYSITYRITFYQNYIWYNDPLILLLEEILHQWIYRIDSLSQYLQGFVHPIWWRISSINAILSLPPPFGFFGSQLFPNDPAPVLHVGDPRIRRPCQCTGRYAPVRDSFWYYHK